MHAAEYERIFVELFGHQPKEQDRYNEAELEVAETRLGHSIPPPLRQYDLSMGKHDLNSAHNRLFPPHELIVEDHHVEFLQENQSVCSWAYKDGVSVDNPIVHQGYEGEWHPENLKLAEFLELMIYLQCVWGGLPIAGDHIQIEALLKVLESEWDLVANDNGLRIWQKDGRLISHLDGDSICAGSAADEDSFALLSEFGFELQ